MYTHRRVTSGLLLVISLLLSACGSGAADSSAPALNVPATVSVKEKSQNTITANGASGNFSWTQISGPQLQLSNNQSATLSFTTPAVDADSQAVLQVSLTTADNKSSSQQVSIQIKNNQLPVMTAHFNTVDEKEDAELSIQASDPDGSISQILWEQVSGPAIAMTGSNSNKIRFTVPAVSSNSEIGFRITLTDNDNEKEVYYRAVTIRQLLVKVPVRGKVTAPELANTNLTIFFAGGQFAATLDSKGEFDLKLEHDDDESNFVALFKVNPLNELSLSYYTLVPDLQTLAAQPLQINAWSTAWYAALVAANSQKEPKDIASIVAAERKALVATIPESAAVAALLFSGKVALPFSSNNLLHLLSNKTQLDELKNKINTEQPALLANTQQQLLSDHTQQPQTAHQRILYEIAASMPGYTTAVPVSYAFAREGYGDTLRVASRQTFTWQQQQNQLRLSWNDYSTKVSEPVVAGLMGMTEQQAQQVRSYMQNLQLERNYQHTELMLLVQGVKRHLYAVTDTYLQEMQQLVLPGLTLPAQQQQLSKTRYTLMAVPDEEPATFSKEELTGEWAFYRYLKQAFNPVDNYYLDPLTFNPDGTGQTSNTKQQFNWALLTGGTLHIGFNDGTSMQMLIFEKVGDFYQVYIRYYENHAPVAAVMSLALPVSATDAQQTTISNNTNAYWQTMSGLSSPTRWNGMTLPVTASDNSNNVRGLQFRADNSGDSVSSTKFTFSPQLSTRFSWTLTQDHNNKQIIRGEGNWSCPSGQVCFRRDWRILKVVPGLIGKRIYLEENVWLRFDNKSNFEHLTGPALTFVEEVPYSYFQPTP